MNVAITRSRKAIPEDEMKRSMSISRHCRHYVVIERLLMMMRELLRRPNTPRREVAITLFTLMLMPTVTGPTRYQPVMVNMPQDVVDIDCERARHGEEFVYESDIDV